MGRAQRPASPDMTPAKGLARPTSTPVPRRGTEVRLRAHPRRRTLEPVATTTRSRIAGRAARLIVSVVLLGALLGSHASSATAEALAAPTAQRHGRCSDRSTWRLAIRPGVEGIWRLRLEIATGRADQRWTIFMNRNGVHFFGGSRLSDELGDVLARVGGDDRPGEDRFRFGAANVVTGETCQGFLAVDRPA